MAVAPLETLSQKGMMAMSCVFRRIFVATVRICKCSVHCRHSSFTDGWISYSLWLFKNNKNQANKIRPYNSYVLTLLEISKI